MSGVVKDATGINRYPLIAERHPELARKANIGFPPREKPDIVIIGPRIYTIHWDAESWEGYQGQAEANHEKLTIHIKPSMSPDIKADCLLHEILHCCLNITCGDIDNYKDVENMDEHVVTVITPWLMMALKQNFDVVDYIREPW